MNDMLKEQGSSYLFGSNADFIEELYESYLQDPNNVDTKWRNYFDSIQDGKVPDSIHSKIRDKFAFLTQNPNFAVGAQGCGTHSCGISGGINEAQAKVWQLIENYRMLGVESADLDPLKMAPIVPAKIFDIEQLGLANELNNEFYIDFDINNGTKLKLKDIIAKFNAIYCGTVGFEYTYVTDYTQREWLKNYIETRYLQFTLTIAEKKQLLSKLTESDGLERFLNTRFVGQKRFSLEGGDSLIPALDRMINDMAAAGTKELYIGMAHRGRLNVLVNINGKTPAKVFEEFEGSYKFPEFATSGDVKYHKGYKCNYVTENGTVKITTLYNPSHLEVVNPVLNGAVRARQDIMNNTDDITGIIIHGDSALIGLGTNQGVFNMAYTRAYGVDGLIHIVINNQVGFTTSDIHDVRSSRFCTDLVKMIEAPVIHVNADDVEKVAFVMDLATEYRRVFKRDIMIDLVCFRRHGHNEGDDPSLTQPLMYRKVKEHPGTRKVYADKLVAENIMTDADVDNMFEAFRAGLTEGKHINADKMQPLPIHDDFDIKPVLKAKPFDLVKTAIKPEDLLRITEAVTTIPNDKFKLHPTILRTVIEPRKQMGAGNLAVDFGMAETLAYGSLLLDGVNIRICGEDSGRGTFSHRHAVWHNFDQAAINDTGYVPLRKLENNSTFHIYDSVLNEECAVGFEYGYSITNLKYFVMWEAQYGDFANGAQVMIDQFIASGEVKWGVLNNITMMLPHGFDGSGPEHSSARLERFLQLSAENNLQIVVPSTAAQMFHLIRRHGLGNYIKPLIIFMPKRLLRSKDAASSINEFTNGEFQFVIGDTAEKEAQKTIEKVIMCSGSIYYDLLNERKNRNLDKRVAIIRIEQLYPFPFEALTAELTKYRGIRQFMWVQEEPHNQGAWMQIRDCLELVADAKIEVVSRDSSAAPACGLMAMHNEQLKQILAHAFN